MFRVVYHEPRTESYRTILRAERFNSITATLHDHSNVAGIAGRNY
jgi:hypothetical protein